LLCGLGGAQPEALCNVRPCEAFCPRKEQKRSFDGVHLTTSGGNQREGGT
jgi:hypothetical protein